MNSMADMNSPLDYELPFIIPPKVQKTLIIDMMAVLQSMKKMAQMKTMSNLLSVIYKCLTVLSPG